MYTIGPLTEVNMVLFLRNKRFNVNFFISVYQLRSAHAAKHVWVAFVYFCALHSPPPQNLQHGTPLLFNLYIEFSLKKQNILFKHQCDWAKQNTNVTEPIKTPTWLSQTKHQRDWANQNTNVNESITGCTTNTN